MRPRWAGRIALLTSIAMIGGMVSIWNASGQQAGEALPVIGVDVASATTTQVTYSFVVTNRGSAASTNVRVESTVPTNTTFEASTPPPSPPASPTPGSTTCDNGGTRESPGTKCEWTLGGLAPGESKTVAAVYNINQNNVDDYTVTMAATARDGEGHSNTDSDASLTRDRIATAADDGDDTFVKDTEPTDTVHGECPVLRVSRDNVTTSFVDTDALPAETDIESFWGGQLRLVTENVFGYSSGSPGTIGAHRITSAEWTEGSGDCDPGTTSSTGTDARTGTEPTSAVTATGTGQVTGSEEVVRIDITPDLDSVSERSSYQGWELRDAASTTPADTLTEFDSAESADETQTPRLFLVYSEPEGATCVDADPDTATNTPSAEHTIDGYVTDGAKIKDPEAGDACNGAPVQKNIVWLIETDSPDAFISNVNGTATAGQPNTATGSTDSAGKGSIGVRLANPAALNSPGTNRISARIEGGTDVAEPGGSTCAPSPLPNNCPGENGTEDDVTATWNPGTATGSPTQTTTATATATATSSPTQTATASPTQTSTATGTATGSPTESPTPTPRTVTLASDDQDGKVKAGAQVQLSGEVVSSDAECEANEFIQIRRRVHGTTEFQDLTNTNTDADGRFSLVVKVNASADFVAFASGHDNCAEDSSDPVQLLAKVKVSADASDNKVPQGDNVRITGGVKPAHDGTKVVLQRKKGGKFVKVDSDKLSGRSRFEFVLSVDWRGKRVFRVKWPSQDDNHAAGASKKFTIKAT